MSASESDKLHRNSIALENAEVLSHRGFEAEQYVLRVYAPRIAARTEPGMFAHLECGHALPMRRPLSIMRADPEAGHLEFLYKAVGAGTRLLAERRPGERISILGPIGEPFTLRADDALPLLIGGGSAFRPWCVLPRGWAGRADVHRRRSSSWARRCRFLSPRRLQPSLPPVSRTALTPACRSWRNGASAADLPA